MLNKPDDYEPTDKELAYSDYNMTLLREFGIYDMLVGASSTIVGHDKHPLTTYQVLNTLTGVTEYDGFDFAMAFDVCVHLEGAWAEVFAAKSAIMTPPDKKIVLQ